MQKIDRINDIFNRAMSGMPEEFNICNEDVHDIFIAYTEVLQELSELKGLLEDIEWINTNFNAYKGNICVCCYNHINDGHKPDCKLAKFIEGVE